MKSREGGAAEEEVTESTQNHNGKGVLFCPHPPPGVSFAAALRGSVDQKQPQPQTSQVPVAPPPTTPRQNIWAPTLQQRGQSVQAPLVNSQPIDNMLKVVTVVQQVMKEVSGALSQEEQIVAITKIVLKLMNQNGH
jgi:hypothetical protein